MSRFARYLLWLRIRSRAPRDGAAMLFGFVALVVGLWWARAHHALPALGVGAAAIASAAGGTPGFGGPPKTFLFDTWRPTSGVAVVAGTAFNVTATTTTVQDLSIAGSCTIGGIDCATAFGGGGTASDPLTAAHWSSTSGTDTATVPFVGEQGATLDSRLAFNGGDSAHSAYVSAYSAPFPTPTPTPPPTLAAEYDAHVGVYKDAACTLPVVDLDPVGCWADQSGNGYNLTQATVAFRPIYHAAASPIGAPGILFDGVNDILVAAGFAGVNIGGAYVVGNYTGGATLASFDGMFSTVADPDTGIMFTGASGTANWYGGGGRFIGGGGVAFTQVDGATTQSIAPLATWHVSVGDVNLNAPAPAGGGLQVGQDRTFGGARAWTGYIAAAGVYTTSPGALNDARINQVLRSIFIEAPSPGLAGLLYHIPAGVGAHRFDGAMALTSSLDVAGTSNIHALNATDETVDEINIGNSSSIIYRYSCSAVLDFPLHGPLDTAFLNITCAGGELIAGDHCKVTTALGPMNGTVDCDVVGGGANNVRIAEVCINGAAGTCDTLSQAYHVEVTNQ